MEHVSGISHHFDGRASPADFPPLCTLLSQTAPLIQRDYGLIQQPGSYTSSYGTIPEGEEEQEQPEDGSLSRSESLSQADDEDHDQSDAGNDSHVGGDNMSHLSIENASHTGSSRRSKPQQQQQQRRQRPSQNGRRASSNSSGKANTTLQPRSSSAVESQQQEEPHASTFLSTSLLLGGDATKPPPGADLRTEEEAIRDGDGAEWEDNDPTPMPGRFEQWIARPPLTRQHLEARQQQLAENGMQPTESTSLLSSSQQHRAAAPDQSSVSQSVAGYHSIAPTHPHPSASGWSINVAQYAAPQPHLADVEEVLHEPTAHIRRRELAMVTRYSLPVWGTHLLELSLNVVSVFSIGHLGTIPLAAASLSSMTANVTAFSLLSGFISALDSLLPPAFTQQPKRVGVYTQSMAIIVALLCFPIAAMWLNAERLLLALGQEPEVARLSGLYLRIMLPGVPAYAGFEVCRRYLQAQGLMSASTVVLCLVSPFNAVLNYLLVWGPDSIRIGFVGAPLASAISNWLMFVLALGQCYICPRTAWGGWSLSSALKSSNIVPCMSLGFFGFLAISSEWWAWEISSLITSLLGTTPLAAQSVLLVCSSITYQQPFAISVAVAVRVGNLLGALKPRDAKISSNAGMVLSLLSGVFNSSLILIFRRPIASAFSEDPEVIELLTDTLPLLALFQVADGIAGVSGGILRGTGRQHLGAYLNMVAYYVVALPMGAWLTFQGGFGLPGMWMGLTTALGLSSIGGLYLTYKTDWDVEVEKVQARMAEGAGPAGGAAAVGDETLTPSADHGAAGSHIRRPGQSATQHH